MPATQDLTLLPTTLPTPLPAPYLGPFFFYPFHFVSFHTYAFYGFMNNEVRFSMKDRRRSPLLAAEVCLRIADALASLLVPRAGVRWTGGQLRGGGAARSGAPAPAREVIQQLLLFLLAAAFLPSTRAVRRLPQLAVPLHRLPGGVPALDGRQRVRDGRAGRAALLGRAAVEQVARNLGREYHPLIQPLVLLLRVAALRTRVGAKQHAC